MKGGKQEHQKYSDNNSASTTMTTSVIVPAKIKTQSNSYHNVIENDVDNTITSITSSSYVSMNNNMNSGINEAVFNNYQQATTCSPKSSKQNAAAVPSESPTSFTSRKNAAMSRMLFGLSSRNTTTAAKSSPMKSRPTEHKRINSDSDGMILSMSTNNINAASKKKVTNANTTNSSSIFKQFRGRSLEPKRFRLNNANAAVQQHQTSSPTRKKFIGGVVSSSSRRRLPPQHQLSRSSKTESNNGTSTRSVSSTPDDIILSSSIDRSITPIMDVSSAIHAASLYNSTVAAETPKTVPTAIRNEESDEIAQFVAQRPQQLRGRSVPAPTITSNKNSNGTSVVTGTTTLTGLSSITTKTAPDASAGGKTTSTAVISTTTAAEQALFEQRLSEETVGVRKIGSHGRSNLRHLKCVLGGAAIAVTTNVPPDSANNDSTTKSTKDSNASMYKLVWGNSKRKQIQCNDIVAVYVGKYTDKSKRCTNLPSNRILSLLTMASIQEHDGTEETNNNDRVDNATPSSKSSSATSLDIEAPTQLDRDKFARAFSTFLNVPIRSSEDESILETPPVGVIDANTNEVTTGTTKDKNSEPNAVAPSTTATGGCSVKSNIDPSRNPRQLLNSSISTPNTTNSEPKQQPDDSDVNIAIKSNNSNSNASQEERASPVSLPPVRSFQSAPGDTMLLTAPLPKSTTPMTARVAPSSAEGSFLPPKPPRHPTSGIVVTTGGGGGSQNNKSCSNRSHHNTIQSGSNPASRNTGSSGGGGGTTGDGGTATSNGVGTGTSRTLGSSSQNTDFGGTGVIIETKPRSSRSNSKHSSRRRRNHRRTDNKNAYTSDMSYGDDDDISHVSSLTGHGYDQELVEELHQALTDTRTALEESRAEAARAVKIAEQAIQSAEQNEGKSSEVWHNTVTHRAAEAAAQAQKKSAQALARQRVAEDRLEEQKRSASFWRRQSEFAEEEAGVLHTRAAAAEVSRAVLQTTLAAQRRDYEQLINGVKSTTASTEQHQRMSLDAALAKNRALELQLDEVKAENSHRVVSDHQSSSVLKTGKKSFNNLIFRSRKGGIGKDGRSNSNVSSSAGSADDGSAATPSTSPTNDGHQLSDCVSVSSNKDGDNENNTIPNAEDVRKVHAESKLLRQQFELFKRATLDETQQLSDEATRWGVQVSDALQSSRSETHLLQHSFAMECAARRKLLNEVQDLRGTVRVYCRPRHRSTASSSSQVLSLPSNDTVLLQRGGTLRPVSFEFDRVFDPSANQHDIYAEIEEVCLGVLDGYNVCVMVCGPANSGRTRTLLGEIQMEDDGSAVIAEPGVLLRTVQQVFQISENRRDRYQDTITLTIVEVDNERLKDVLAATDIGQSRGETIYAETKACRKKKNHRKNSLADDDSKNSSITNLRKKLEIRTDVHGETVVQGLVSVEVKSYDDVTEAWQQCLNEKRTTLEETRRTEAHHSASCHVITTLKVSSTNITTGIQTTGKVQFADLASADVETVSSKNDTSIDSRSVSDEAASSTHTRDWRFVNRSLDTLNGCVDKRLQFVRSVPYRNSTLTHLLRDSLESDTKTIFMACVTSDVKDIEHSIGTLRLASKMRRVQVGKATRHTSGGPSAV